MTSPKVDIVILNWNGKDDTLACLESVFQIDYPSYEVIVVDNGSTDDSVPTIRQAFPQAHLIETGENLGYAGGNNVGIRHALERGADFIFVLNNDTTVAPDILTHLVNAAAAHPDTAAFGPVILEQEYPDRIWTAGEHFAEDGLTCVHYRHGKMLSELDREKHRRCDWINGAAFFARASFWKKNGFFDKRFFLVYEESDWCFRARKLGHPCRMAPKARVWHKVAGSFGSESSPLRAYFSTRNQLLFAEKNLPKATWFKLVRRAFIKLMPTLPQLTEQTTSVHKKIYWALRDSARHWRHPRQRAIRRGIVDYFTRRFGNCPDTIHDLNRRWLALRRNEGN